jgi:gluconolactonase
MAQDNFQLRARSPLLRRRLLGGAGAALGVAMLAPRPAHAQAGKPAAPPSTVTQPPRDFGPNGAPTTYFTDPDVLTVDPAFNGLLQPNAPIQRLWRGAFG